MSVAQTVLVFVVIPLGIIGLISFAVYGKSVVRQPNRYRPGRPWNHEPSWYVPHPDAVAGLAAHPQVEGAAGTKAVGGASGEW